MPIALEWNETTPQEAALEGKEAGDSSTVEVQPADGYGDYDDELLDEFDEHDHDGHNHAH